MSYSGQGTGTSTDPFIITSWNEFVEACANTDNGTETYCELANDIYAPNTLSTTVDGYRLRSLDGKGHTIWNWTVAPNSDVYINDDVWGFNFGYGGGSYRHIKNIKFKNVECSGVGFIRINPYNSATVQVKIDNVEIAGQFYGGTSIFARSNSSYVNNLIINKLGVNVKVNYGTFKFQSRIESSLSMDNGNIKINFVTNNTSDYMFHQYNVITKTTFELYGEHLTTSLYFGGNLTNCLIHGKTNNSLILMNGSGIIPVEDTIELHTAISSSRVCTTAQIKDASYLASIGFPIGVEG